MKKKKNPKNMFVGYDSQSVSTEYFVKKRSSMSDINQDTENQTPPLSTRLGQVGRSVYSQLVKRKEYEEQYPLHVGDTYLPPAIDVRSLNQSIEIHRYTPVNGQLKLNKHF